MSEPPSKRRKVRKGTHSCWQCRKRKIKCHFDTDDIPSESTSPSSPDSLPTLTPRCIPCRARGSPCISQEYGDEYDAALDSNTTTTTASATIAASNSSSSSSIHGGHARASPTVKTGLADRLGRLEELMGSLVNHAARGGDAAKELSARASAALPSPDDSSATPDEASSVYMQTHNHLFGTCPSACGEISRDISSVTTPTSHNIITNPSGPSSSSASSSAPATTTAIPTAQPPPPSNNKYASLSRDLYALFPPRSVRQILARHSFGTDFVLTAFSYPRDIAAGRSPPESTLVDLPPPSSHPALLAKHLLQLAICLQKMCTACPETPMGQLVAGLAPRSLAGAMEEWVAAAARLVTSNDDLVGCIEGLECLVFQSVYYSDAGHLRKSWITTRRAVSMAQLLYTDRRTNASSGGSLIRSCDPLTSYSSTTTTTTASGGGSESDPSHARAPLPLLWWRINCCDRFLSLLLGLPIGSRENPPIDPDEPELTRDKLGRIYSVLAAKVADRNHIAQTAAADANSSSASSSSSAAAYLASATSMSTTTSSAAKEAYALTHALDIELEDALSIPDSASWWTTPRMADALTLRSRLAEETYRLQLQQRHYILLIVVHLPYMLRGRDQPRYAYNRAQCMAGSRAALERFLEFRGTFKDVTMGRIGDYSAMVAAMTLLLAHLRPSRKKPSQQQQQQQHQDVCIGSGSTVTVGALESAPPLDDADRKTREQDRALVDKVRATMQELADTNQDRLSQQGANVISDMLPLALGGGCGGGGEDDGVGGEDVANVHFTIPFFGTVNITSRSEGRDTTVGMETHDKNDNGHVSQNINGTTSSVQANALNTTISYTPNTRSVLPPATTSSNIDIINNNNNNPRVPFFFGGYSDPNEQQQQQQEQQQQQHTMDPSGDYAAATSGYPAMGWPELSTDMDDWTFQGVETTYWSMLNSAMV